MTLIEKSPWFASVPRKKRWLVGVSGGADSVALLHLMVVAGFSNLVVCHLDHGLRGRASAGDALFVKRLAAKLGLPSEVGKADVTAGMRERGESMETAARHARHAFFADCSRKHRCPRIVLAHHADDQAETVLWNLLRGSHGLKGMRALQNFTTGSGAKLEFHRPLLAMRRADLIGWLISAKFKWREDASNAEPVALRNRLRNEALPLLAEISGRDPAAAICRALAATGEIESLENWALQQADVLDPQGRLHLGALRKLPQGLQCAALRKFLMENGTASPDRALVESSLSLLDVKNPAAINLPGGMRLRRSAGRLWLDR
ncbi:MAG: tRNA lysidine(34) synthetase TilS [Luteolibacter sp.]